MKLRLFASPLPCSASSTALAGRVLIPVSAPTLSEWGLAGLGLPVAAIAGITTNRRK